MKSSYDIKARGKLSHQCEIDIQSRQEFTLTSQSYHDFLTNCGINEMLNENIFDFCKLWFVLCNKTSDNLCLDVHVHAVKICRLQISKRISLELFKEILRRYKLKYKYGHTIDNF